MLEGVTSLNSPAERFNEALIRQMRDKAEISRYLREDHE